MWLGLQAECGRQPPPLHRCHHSVCCIHFPRTKARIAAWPRAVALTTECYTLRSSQDVFVVLQSRTSGDVAIIKP